MYNFIMNTAVIKILYRCYAYNGCLPSIYPVHQGERLAAIIVGMCLSTSSFNKLKETLEEIERYRIRNGK